MHAPNQPPPQLNRKSTDGPAAAVVVEAATHSNLFAFPGSSCREESMNEWFCVGPCLETPVKSFYQRRQEEGRACQKTCM